MLTYIIYFFIIVLLIIILYFKYKFKFWILQPVFHFYDIQYWFCNKGIIRDGLPEKNKYTNFQDIKTITIDEKVLKSNQMKLFLFFIQKHYLRQKENKFFPHIENVLPYFKSHTHPSFLSVFYEKYLLQDSKQNVIENPKIVGVMTSRPLHLTFHNSTPIELDVYYVDYLCVDKMKRKAGIAPQIIQTHEYNQSHENKQIVVSLFKREEELTGIVPLCIYKTYCFKINDLHLHLHLENVLPPSYQLLICDSQNIHYLFHSLKTNKNWQVTIMAELPHLLELVKTKNIKIFLLLQKETIVAAYFFRKTCTFIDKHQEIVSCYASIKDKELKQDIFISAFNASLFQIQKSFAYLCIEDISDNYLFLKFILKEIRPLVVSPMAYFLYNYASHTFSSNKVLVLN